MIVAFTCYLYQLDFQPETERKAFEMAKRNCNFCEKTED